MSRPMSPAMLAALQAGHVDAALLFEGRFKNGTINIWTGLGPLEFQEKTWTGAGSLMGMSAVEETDTVQASGVTISLSGVAPENIALALTEMQRGLPGVVYLALFTPAGELIPDPIVWFRGQMDASAIEDSVDAAQIQVSYENELITLEKPREVRYTHEEQLRLYPEDLGLEFIAKMQDTSLPWGSRV